MNTWIALLRGIKVGGRNRLPMKDLAGLFESAGCKQVKTYIQSGNVVFTADSDAPDQIVDDVATAVEKNHGFRPAIFLLSGVMLAEAIAANPYPEAVEEPKTLHLTFLGEAPGAENIEKAGKLISGSERFCVIDHCLYLHAPDGIGRSKFAGSAERALGVSTTGRNWRTMTKLAEMVAAIE